MEKKRLFIGMEVIAPWPDVLPVGRILRESDRHLTLAFLGDVDFSPLETKLADFPVPEFSLGIAARFDRPVFLSNTAGWHLDCLEREAQLLHFQKRLLAWLQLELKEPFLPHVTIARSPFEIGEWKRTFQPLPLYLKNIHLYESLGFLKYAPLWSMEIHSPFEEVDHTADLAFLVRGEDLQQLYLHAALALSFHYPPMIQTIEPKKLDGLEEIVMALNQWISVVDEVMGCPFKAVSFHGALKNKESFLEWEMIVDV